jgi:hypothetical protein
MHLKLQAQSMKLYRSPFFLLATMMLFTCASLLGASINGTVTNRTINKPSVGDTVVLLQLTQGMQEAGRTKTDAKGHFSFELPDNEPHLIRVEHQKGAYFKNMMPGVTQADISVFDVAPKVEGISTEADVLRIEADGSSLKVTENYFVRNTSHPPRTQLSEHSYEIYLPPDAVVEASAAMAPAGMAVASSPVPLGEKGHYAFAFPIRPNEGDSGTRFQLSYHIPYNGSYKFTPRLAIGADNLAILLPKSMKFTPGASAPYQPVNDNIQAQTFLARNVSSSQPLEFTVSGVGAMPREAQDAAGQQGGDTATASNANTDTRPGGGLGQPIDTPDPLNKYKWWILGGLSILLAVAAGFLLRKPALVPAAAGMNSPQVGPTPSVAGKVISSTPAAQRPQGSLLDALKEELFAIETEKLEGKLDEQQYTELKSALEIVLRRALKRAVVS